MGHYLGIRDWRLTEDQLREGQGQESKRELWRFFKLEWFLYMFNGGSLNEHPPKLSIPRADKLSDSLEGRIYCIEANALFSSAAYQQHIEDSDLTTFFANLQNEFPAPTGRDELLERTYISCWHYDFVESTAMWGSFGNDHNGLAIVVDSHKLYTWLSVFFHQCKVGLYRVRYGFVTGAIMIFGEDDSRESIDLARLIYKDCGFQHEEEVRIIIQDYIPPESSQSCRLEIPFPTEEIIKRVVIGKGVSLPDRERINAIAKTYFPTAQICDSRYLNPYSSQHLNSLMHWSHLLGEGDQQE